MKNTEYQKNNQKMELNLNQNNSSSSSKKTKRLEELKKMFLKLIKERNHTLIKMDLINKKETILVLKCNRCNTEFTTKGHNYTRAGGKTTEANYLELENKHFFPYCCPGCKKTYKQENIIRPTGENHPRWKGDITLEKRPGYNAAKYRKWREGVFTFYKGKCFLTGSTDHKNLEAHHMDSWQTAPKKRYLVENGVLLRKDIHIDFHKTFGNDVTVAQFEVYCKQNYNIEEFPWSIKKETAKQIENLITSAKEKRLNDFKTKLSMLGLTLVSGVYDNKHSKIVLYCPKHNKTHETTIQNFKKSVYGVPCCANEVSKQQKPPSQKNVKRSSQAITATKKTINKRCQTQIEERAVINQHIINKGTFENSHSTYKIYCPKHDQEYTITYANYMRHKHGLLCCSKNSQNKTNNDEQ